MSTSPINAAAATVLERDLRPRPAQLQINQSGAWRAVLNFDAGDAPPEFLEAAQDLVRFSGSDATMRVVVREPRSSGPDVATHTVLMSWTRTKGWVSA